MFTGIVETLGEVTAVNQGSPTESLVVRAPLVLEDAHIGDSIAVNGTCLTITHHDGASFAVGVVPETIRRSNLGGLQPGDTVNLERPVQPSSRLGGHFVQGHIDGTGMVAEVSPDGNALAIRITCGPHILRYVVEKGFIAVDGASLTVTNVDDTGLGISLVPHSQSHLAPGIRTTGSCVNIEVDILAKYVEKLVVH